MPSKPKIIVTGIKEIDRALRGLEPKIAKKVIRTAMRSALRPVRTAVIEQAPKGETGQLARAVKLRAGKRRKGRIEIDVQIGSGNFKGETFYGAMVELGTKKQKAQHYMKAAYDATKTTARDAAMREISQGVMKEVKR